MKKSMCVMVAAAAIFFLFSTNSATAQCVSGDCANGKGVYRFSNSSQYAGDFRQGKMQGYGAFRYPNGDVYKGEWLKNLAQGKGTYFYQSGEKYEGDFVEGRLEGFGAMFYPNGVRYEGEWKASKKDGRGMFYRKDNTVAKIGYWSAGTFVKEIDPSEENPVVTNNPTAPTAAIKNNFPVEKPVLVSSPEIKIWALVVGVARYNSMPSLRYTDDDAYQFYAFLKSPEGGALPDEQLKVLIDEDATQINICRYLRQFAQKADENDVVMLYFSGHGVDGAFVPSDFDGHFTSALSHEKVRKILEESRAKHKICIADACHAGTLLAAKGSASGYGVERLYSAFGETRGGTALLLSSKAEENSLEDQGLRAGVFSYFFIKGLKGEADADRNKIITVSEIYGYVSKKVLSYTATAQSPVLSGDFDSQMPIAILRN